MANANIAVAQADEDAALVERSRQGDRAAFNELVNRNAQKVFRMARHMTRNDQDAEDVLQEAFLKAFSKLDQFQGDAKFSTWLTRIAVNESLMRLRKGRNSKTVSLDEEFEVGDSAIQREVADDGEDPEQTYGRTEMREILEGAIDSLAEGYRTVFVLRDVEGFSTEETAEMLDLSVSAVKSRLLRARLQLRDKLRRRLKSHGREEKDHV